MTRHPVAPSMNCPEFDDLSRLNRVNRRDLLQIGAIAGLGLGVDALSGQLTAAQDRRAGQGRGRQPSAKSCIFLFMWGGPSQLDTFDLKPEAPVEIRGDFRPISTVVPGIQVCEHFRKLARVTDRLAIIRSLTHDDPAHLSSGHATLTGQLAPVVNSDADPPSSNDSPHLGALLSKLRPSFDGMPGFVAMPWKAYHPAAPGGEAPGQHGGWLGPAHDGMLLSGDPNQPQWRAEGLTLPGDLTLERIESRSELLRILDAQRMSLDAAQAVDAYDLHRERALHMLAAPHVREAFDLNRESGTTRERYGRTIHGQCVLLARRLVERGVPLVAVNWHNDGRNFWDTHGNNFRRLKNDLIPPADQALAALIEDLSERGMLEDTLVAWVGEFGRRPTITANNAGREHWPFCYSGILAGGGINRGLVYGSSDAHAAYPNTNPVSPQDFATTMLHALGVPIETSVLDRENRPHRVATGRVIHELFA